jgi:hypothetical protein
MSRPPDHASTDLDTNLITLRFNPRYILEIPVNRGQLISQICSGFFSLAMTVVPTEPLDRI